MLKINEFTYEIEKEDIKDNFIQRVSNSNKGNFGYVGIMGGSIEYSGAVKLANLSASAMRAGCGVVRLIIPKGIAKASSTIFIRANHISNDRQGRTNGIFRKTNR